jgi:hypothetical protein
MMIERIDDMYSWEFSVQYRKLKSVLLKAVLSFIVIEIFADVHRAVFTYARSSQHLESYRRESQRVKLRWKTPKTRKIFFGIKVTSEAFLSISKNLKVTRLQGGTQTKLGTYCWRNFDLSRSFERFWASFMALLCFSRRSDQKCCETKCVALKTSFQTRLMWAL